MSLSDIKKYYPATIIYTFGLGLVTTFINLFFFTNDSYDSAILFQGFTSFGMIIGFAAAGYVLIRFDNKHLFILGNLFKIVILIALILIAGLTSNLFLFGILYGIGGGLFATGNNIIQHDITKGSDRFSFLSKIATVNGIVSIIAPIAGGLLIEYSLFGGSKFALDFGLAIIMFLISAQLISKLKSKTKRFDYLIKKTLINNKEYNRFSLWFLISPFFFLTVSIIEPIYVFQVTNNYLTVGIFTTITVLVQVIANFVTRNGFKNWDRYVKISILIAILSSVFLIPGMLEPPWNIFAFASLTYIFMIPLENKSLENFMIFVDKNKDTDRTYFWINRDYHLNASRIAVCSLLIVFLDLFLKNSLNLIFVLPILTLASLAYLKTTKESIYGPEYEIHYYSR